MAFITIQINAAGLSVADTNQVVEGGQALLGREIVQNIQNVLDGVKSGTIPAELSISSSDVAGTISGQTGGVAAFTVNLK